MNASSSPSISIRRAVPEDCHLLSRLGMEAYRQHFTYLWTPEGLDRFFASAYTPEFFRDTLEDENGMIWLVEEEGQPLGYLMYFRKEKLPGREQKGGYVNRIYLLQRAMGKGAGSRLMSCALQQARRDGCTYLWLESMQSSTESIQFYQKHGFEISGATAYTKVAMRDPELAKMWYMVKDL
ncbi:GNAT family N-acetyltransferase [Flavilitoribacter nigricans]|uniref:N-acetyltransferase domain-containing protein n=1 Tax=Flavilitoribacter nigricans (strain ATCC 23147 / DSM 23189 / NBRC 102662 / NCIMB 1420 / SS-2) TaxID=1122177 RepID=A0A2D0N4S0_FLAN2|nr:GNAT family N-acetyltransferase [Flavilitoribacter nigricans]PHN03494.1 hypothetical protein CRP01_26190 [Flavilitoribacter nigricans DSM 23189 = NBRC 102662]